MATYHVDLVNGSDAADGSSATPWLTITSGPTAGRLAPGDFIKISKTPAPYSIGNGTWTNGPIPSSQSISSSTNATPIVITKNSHGYVNGDVVFIAGHQTNTNANGAWIVANKTTNTFELQGSTGNGVGGTTGTVQLINSKTVKLASAQTKTVDTCDNVWTNAAGGDTTCSVQAVTVNGKQGGNCSKFLLSSTPHASTLQAYKAFSGAIDFSAYQKITFLIYNSAAIASGTYSLLFCSDNAGVTVVDTFDIPAISSTARWLALTIARNGGGNCGSSIQSVALTTGATVPVASSNILIDNIEACTTSGLNLQSLISKNSLEQGGTEGWYAIQSIKDTLVLLDGDSNTLATGGKGYFGTTETVGTYARETFKTALAATSTAVVSAINLSGTYGNSITFSGGWNTSGWTVQDGETFLDGRNGNGYGIAIQSKSYINVDHISTVRYYNGFVADAVGFNITNILTSGFHQNTSISGASSGFNGVINGAVLIGYNAQTGIVLSSNANCTISNISKLHGNINYGITCGGGLGNIVDTCSFTGNGQFDIYSVTGGDIRAKNCIFGSTATNITSGSGGKIYAFNCSFSGTVYASQNAFSNGGVYSTKHGGVVGDNRIYSDSASVQSQATNRSGADAGELMYRITISGSSRHIGYPMIVHLSAIPVVANEARTIKLWMCKGHATNVGGKLVLRGGQIAGVANDVTATKANDTNWEQLSISFTPTESGVVVIEGWGYYISGNSTIDIGKVDWI